MKRVLRASIVLAIAVVVMGHAPGAWACMCVQLRPGEAYDHASTVFTGTVTDREDPHDGAAIRSSTDPIYWTFAVDGVEKGEVGDTIAVGSGEGGGSCGQSFTLGARYRIFTHSVEDKLYTGICNGNEQLAAGPDSAAPGAGAPGPAASQGSTVPILLLSGSMLTVGLVLVLRRRLFG